MSNFCSAYLLIDLILSTRDTLQNSVRNFLENSPNGNFLKFGQDIGEVAAGDCSKLSSSSIDSIPQGELFVFILIHILMLNRRVTPIGGELNHQLLVAGRNELAKRRLWVNGEQLQCQSGATFAHRVALAAHWRECP